MGKVYEWAMAEAPGGMNEASEQGWEYVSGPFPYTFEGETFMSCLMRREVVPGRVAPEPSLELDLLSRPYVDDHPPAREHVAGTEDGLGEQSDPLHNCWTCKLSTSDATGCSALRAGRDDVRRWVSQSHSAFDEVCPHDADGCPGWTPKATP
jgi:hypothetical protein